MSRISCQDSICDTGNRGIFHFLTAAVIADEVDGAIADIFKGVGDMRWNHEQLFDDAIVNELFIGIGGTVSGGYQAFSTQNDYCFRVSFVVVVAADSFRPQAWNMHMDTPAQVLNYGRRNDPATIIRSGWQRDKINVFKLNVFHVPYYINFHRKGKLVVRIKAQEGSGYLWIHFF
jgi:hypothetical protein